MKNLERNETVFKDIKSLDNLLNNKIDKKISFLTKFDFFILFLIYLIYLLTKLFLIKIFLLDNNILSTSSYFILTTIILFKVVLLFYYLFNTIQNKYTDFFEFFKIAILIFVTIDSFFIIFIYKHNFLIEFGILYLGSDVVFLVLFFGYLVFKL
jgi:hypothetical protein